MAKFGEIEFDDRILDALRDDRLVVFAGAGVSMGPPSNLPSFWKLTCDISQGTGLQPSEPLDRYLGQLHHKKVNVHTLAAKYLSPEGSAPNSLHRNLLRLFRTTDRVRLVTTNFDLHFETAANELFSSVPEVYRAPALPLGYDFSGIVYVHGSLTRSRDLVLTDADFGRAYLTEGWARRFLVDLFRHYTVLFVGYSHNDVVMNYLARALPADSLAGRFALTDEDGSWDLLGIKPIRFKKFVGEDAFGELYDGVLRLADRMSRGVLDWQSRLAELGARKPPLDPEAISEVEQALREVHTTRFLLEIARDPEWLFWLNGRKYFDNLFADVDLSERDKLFANWLTQYFVIEHPEAVFEIVAKHGLRMNPFLWWSVGREFGATKEKFIDESGLKCWATIMLASLPPQPDHFVLMWLADRCGEKGCIEITLKCFLAMSVHRFSIRPGYSTPDGEESERRKRLDAECLPQAEHWPLKEVWKNHLKPNLAKIALPLMSGIMHRLEEMHGELAAWGNASRDWSPASVRRSAVEPHEQDQHPEAVDVIVDAARDALEWIAANSNAQLGAWIEILVTSNVPLLRRLAIHAITVDPERSADDRLNWILDRVGLHGASEHHEVHRAVAMSYSRATESTRRAVVDAILGQSLLDSEFRPGAIRTARAHFDWLSWLLDSKPDCSLAGEALSKIKAQFPEWLPSEHPDLTRWIGPVVFDQPVSPTTVELLLARDPRSQLDDLLHFRGSYFGGPSRDGLLVECREACKQNPNWAFKLGRALAERPDWATDFWPALLRGLQDSEMSEDGWRELLELVSYPALQAAHPDEIANLLYSLVRDGGKPFASELLERANDIALSIWETSEAGDSEGIIEDWLHLAINRPAGVIVEFWLNSLSVAMRQKSISERSLPDNYRNWFTKVVEETGTKGGLGRTLLASQTSFLFGLDESWTRQLIIPMFRDPDPHKFAQVWDGFLIWGRLYPELVDALLPAFIDALPRLNGFKIDRRRRLVEFFTSIVTFHLADPTEELLTAFFRHGAPQDRSSFASHLGSILRHMQHEAKRRIWFGWLKRYWQDRQQGVYAALDESEIRAMLGWLPHLGEAFPEAVTIAVSSKAIQLERCRVLYDLQESELVTLYPVETAELLIYLANCGIGSHAALLRKIDARLPPLPVDVRMRVNEAFAQAGISRAEED